MDIDGWKLSCSRFFSKRSSENLSKLEIANSYKNTDINFPFIYPGLKMIWWWFDGVYLFSSGFLPRNICHLLRFEIRNIFMSTLRWLIVWLSYRLLSFPGLWFCLSGHPFQAVVALQRFLYVNLFTKLLYHFSLILSKLVANFDRGTC